MTKYKKVKVTKMMVEHMKMTNGKVREVVSSKLYDTMDEANKAVDISANRLEHTLEYSSFHSAWRHGLMTTPRTVAGFRDGKPEFHWYRVVCVVEVPDE
jgi:hypothetical protein